MEQDVRRIEEKTQETALQLQQYQEEPDPWVNSVEDPLRCEKQHTQITKNTSRNFDWS